MQHNYKHKEKNLGYTNKKGSNNPKLEKFAQYYFFYKTSSIKPKFLFHTF